MVFVSHSTSDHLWVRGNIVVPLRELKIPVAASYHFMPDASRYDDKAIHGAMADSCMVLIALSPGYLNSGRSVWSLPKTVCSVSPKWLIYFLNRNFDDTI